MKLKKLVRLDEQLEIDVDISVGDIVRVLREEQQTGAAPQILDAVWQSLRAIDHERLSANQRETIADALLRESQRFAPVTRAPYGGTDKSYCLLGYDRLGSSTHPWFLQWRTRDDDAEHRSRFDSYEQAFEHQMAIWHDWRKGAGLPVPTAARYEARVCALCEDPFDANVGDGRTLCASCEKETGCDR